MGYQEIVVMLSTLQGDVNALLQAQKVNNFLALSNNPQVPEEIRKEALSRAMEMMNLTKTKAEARFEDLPSNIVR